MLTLFSALLTISVGSVLAIIATVLVFAQVVTGEFSRRAAALLFRDRLLTLTLGVNAAAASINLWNSYIHAASDPSVLIPALPNMDRFGRAEAILTGFVWYVTQFSTAAGLTGIGFLLLLLTMFRLTDYLNAPALASRITSKMRFAAVREFAAHRYGVEEPNEYQYGLFSVKYGEEERRVAGDQWERNVLLLRRDRTAYKRLKRRLEKLRKSGALIDPFALLVHLAATSISEHDADAFRSVLSTLQQRIEVWKQIGEIRQQNDMGRWDPERHWSALLTSHLEYLTEIAVATQHPSTLTDLASFGERLSLAMIKPPIETHSATELVNFMGHLGVRSIDEPYSGLLGKVADGLSSIGKATIDALVNDPNPERHATEFFDQICRVLGFLGERIALRGTKRRPIMPHVHEEREAYIIAGALGELATTVGEKGQPDYPLILRDALDLFANRLAHHDPKGPETVDTLHFLISAEEGLAIRAAKDPRFSPAMAWVVCGDFVSLAETFVTTGLERLLSDLAIGLCQIGAAAVIGGKESDNPGSHGSTLADNVIDAMVRFPDRTKFGTSSGGPLFDLEWRVDGPEGSHQRLRDFARRARGALSIS